MAETARKAFCYWMAKRDGGHNHFTFYFTTCTLLLMNRPVLEVVELSRVLEVADGVKPGSRPLLRGVSFRLHRGQVLAVLGPSGAGKSTLLRMLNRLDEPSGGQILLDGEDTRGIDPRDLRRRIGMVMQRPYLFPGTAAMNVGYGPAQAGVTLSGPQIENLLERVGMQGFAERDVATLSGGEAQRVSIARALANEPEILLLDEPTSALDPEAKEAVERLLVALVRERHATCVWVTHDVAQAVRVADLVLRIEAGEAVALGTPEEMLHA
jgi:putative ABC transport system ATP-binding protein